MNARLIQRQLHDSLFDLYMQGGLEMVSLGSRGIKRELIIQLETSGLTSETGEIIRYHAINRWDEDDEFFGYDSPCEPLCSLTEGVTGLMNED
jgi:hypothetical protein